ncbi:MAG: bifunctional DNA-formamidopyrimidine glycosylase/DNA-(apurinic or apyrimidinic site) lyase [Methylococcaceae bacterium]|nr:MAG: bifunctional DNA-formamidopyrimidine glycosylase/DNA-(apurinic or apyrimidinic site) lyase [Methylococcaceae bacterium]
MPELPEVETTCRGIAPHIEGQCIAQVELRQSKLRWPVTEHLAQRLQHQVVRKVYRRAKYIIIECSQGHLLIHLGMSGSLRIVSTNTPAGKHDHLDIIFTNNTCLRFNDPRRFGAVLWTDQPILTHPLLNALGPEPLAESFTGAMLYQVSRTRKVPIKTFIMDSHIVVGVGNIYANEALFNAGIRPTRQAGNISLQRYEKLADCIVKVLHNAIAQGGTTLRNFVNEAGKPGYFKQSLHVYGRAGQACHHCGEPLQEVRIANRSTVFCKHCQR